MTDMFEQEKQSRKKFLIPLLALLMCGVAFTGAAYAYYSDVTENGTVGIDDTVYINVYTSKECNVPATGVQPTTAKFAVAPSTVDGVTTYKYSVIDFTTMYVKVIDNLPDSKKADIVTAKVVKADGSAITEFTYTLTVGKSSDDVGTVVATNVENGTPTNMKISEYETAQALDLQFTLTKDQAKAISENGSTASIGFKIVFTLGTEPTGTVVATAPGA